MVATVIAILALLVLPLYRKRVQEAREVAARDEVASIAKGQLLAEADLGYQIRLQDMDNGEEIEGVDLDGSNVDIYPPIAAWNGTLQVVRQDRNRVSTVKFWHGPYASLNNYALVDDLQEYWYDSPIAGPVNAGFIYVVDGTASGPSFPGPSGPVNDNTAEDRYPLDPWGTPYAFYGPGRFPHNNPDNSESTFNFSIVVSFGPDGAVAEGQPSALIDRTNYRRFNPASPGSGGLIGDEHFPDTDDIIYRF